jgi:hypothetical protein
LIMLALRSLNMFMQLQANGMLDARAAMSTGPLHLLKAAPATPPPQLPPSRVMHPPLQPASKPGHMGNQATRLVPRVLGCAGPPGAARVPVCLNLGVHCGQVGVLRVMTRVWEERLVDVLRASGRLRARVP